MSAIDLADAPRRSCALLVTFRRDRTCVRVPVDSNKHASELEGSLR